MKLEDSQRDIIKAVDKELKFDTFMNGDKVMDIVFDYLIKNDLLNL